MSSEKIYHFSILQNHSNFDIKVNKSSFIVLLLPILMVSAPLAFNINTVNAQLNLDDFMKQTQDNIQSTIESSNKTMTIITTIVIITSQFSRKLMRMVKQRVQQKIHVMMEQLPLPLLTTLILDLLRLI